MYCIYGVGVSTNFFSAKNTTGIVVIGGWGVGGLFCFVFFYKGLDKSIDLKKIC